MSTTTTTTAHNGFTITLKGTPARPHYLGEAQYHSQGYGIGFCHETVDGVIEQINAWVAKAGEPDNIRTFRNLVNR